MAQCTLGMSPFGTSTLKHYTGYTEEQLSVCAKITVNLHAAAAPGSKLRAVFKKFCSLDLCAVALLSPGKNFKTELIFFFPNWVLPQPLVLCTFCDTDWASDPDDHCSTSWADVYLGPATISGGSTKQTVVARSTAEEAEYCSLAQFTTELLWYQTLLRIASSFLLLNLLCFLWQSEYCFSHNPILHAKTKHMEYHFSLVSIVYF